MGQQKTTKIWVEEARGIWGETFDYSKPAYTKSKEKITITCLKPEHGDFTVVAANHITTKRTPAGCWPHSCAVPSHIYGMVEAQD